MMGEVLCSDYHTLTPDMDHIQIGVFCLLTRKRIRILFLGSSPCYRSDHYTGIQTLTQSCYGTSSFMCKCCFSSLWMSLKSFCMQAVFGVRIKTGTYKRDVKNCIHPWPSVVMLPCTSHWITRGRKRNKLWLAPSQKYCVTPHHFSLLLFGFLKCPIVSDWFILSK